MPWASAAQRKYFFANPRLHKYIAEYEAATPKGAKLPDHVPSKKKAHMARKKHSSAFDRLAGKLAQRPGVTNPKALSAFIGRERYGPKVMAQAAARGVPAKSIKG
jgi:hypothetical protein